MKTLTKPQAKIYLQLAKLAIKHESDTVTKNALIEARKTFYNNL